MKRISVAIVLLVLSITATADDEMTPSTGVGLQFSSDGAISGIFRAPHVEVGITFVSFQYDTPEGVSAPGVFIPGLHAEYLFFPGRRDVQFGTGLAFRYGLGTGDVEWDEYIDAGVRFSVHRSISDRTLVSGTLYPFWVETRDVSEVEGDFQLSATLPRGAVAFTVLF